MKKLLFPVIALMLTACGPHNTTRDVNVLVAPNSLPAAQCDLLDHSLPCLIIKASFDSRYSSTWNAWQDGIVKGFTYEPGYLYDLTLTETTYDAFIGDPVPPSYLLKTVNSKVASTDTKQPGQP